MTAAYDESASACYFLHTPQGTGMDQGYVVHSIDIQETGTYYFWARVRAPDWSSDSLRLSWDDGAESVWHLSEHGDWAWERAVDELGHTKTWYLLAREHALTIGSREDGTQIDTISLTQDAAYIPSDAVFCDPPTPTPTSTPTPTPTPTPTMSDEVFCWTGQVGGPADDASVALVEPPENQAYRPEVRMGRRSWDGGWSYYAGLRFSGVPITQGAVIRSARLSLLHKYHTGLPVTLDIAAEAADHSQPFSDQETLAHERPTTSALVVWSVDTAPQSGTWITGPDLTAPVQAVLNRPGWSLYSALSILIASSQGNLNYLDAWAYDQDPELAARLEICYQAGGAPFPTATATATSSQPTPTPTSPPPATSTATPTAPPGATATPTAVVATPTPPRPPAQGSKQGVAWLYSSSVPAGSLANIGSKAVHHWQYDVSKATAALNAGLKYFPVQKECAQGEASVNESAIRTFINASSRFRGLTWLAFNEPDKSDQSACEPSAAARALHKLDRILRSGPNPADPTAKIYCCGLVDRNEWAGYMSDLRSNYASQYGQNPPLDGVHLHLFNWEPTRLDWCRLRDGLDEFRGWQQGQGWLANRPIIVSEWGVLSSLYKHPNDPQWIAGNCAPGCECDTMAGMFDVFERRSWVQYHMWWTSYSDASAAPPGETWNSGNLFTSPSGSTPTNPVGLRFRELSK